MDMKQIEVNDEMYEFLMNLSKELNEQNHRGTRMPYFFQVQTQELTAVPEGCGTEAWNLDGDLIKTDEEIDDAIIEWKDWDKSNSEDMKILADYDYDEKGEILETIGYSKVNFEYKPRLQNSFLTSKACDEHIRVNRHNLSEPRNYLSYAFRNPELEQVMKFLCELSGGKLHV